MRCSLRFGSYFEFLTRICFPRAKRKGGKAASYSDQAFREEGFGTTGGRHIITRKAKSSDASILGQRAVIVLLPAHRS